MALTPKTLGIIAFVDFQSLAAYTATSKTCQAEVLAVDAWEVLSVERFGPRPRCVRREPQAIANIRSQLLRRQLAGDERSWVFAVKPPRPTQVPLTEFSYFLRITEGRMLIWQGDVAMIRDHELHNPIVLNLSEAWNDVKHSWDSMVGFLDHENAMRDSSLSQTLEFTLVAVREVDQAMALIGDFTYRDDNVIGPGVRVRGERRLLPTRRIPLLPLSFLRHSPCIAGPVGGGLTLACARDVYEW